MTTTPSENGSTRIYLTFKQILALIFFLLLGLGTVFVSGFQTHKFLNTSKDIVASPTPTPNLLPTPSISTEAPFVPGKQFFEDTVILITKEKPHITLIASAARFEQTSGFLQNTRVSFFDGEKWHRNLHSQSTNNSLITANTLLDGWSTEIDPSRVLKQKSEGGVLVNNKHVGFKTGILENEIGIRSLPGHTKFMSEGNGELRIDGTFYNAKVLYTRIYSSNSSDIFFYTEDVELETDWVAAWDTEGNFYHVDKTEVKNDIPNYKTHSIGVLKDSESGISKTFTLNVTRDSQNPPKEYTVSFTEPIESRIVFTKINNLNKAPNQSYIWDIGQIEGFADTKDGKTLPLYGLSEYILN